MIISILIIFLWISLHYVDIPLLSKTTRNLITSTLLTRLLAINSFYFATCLLYESDIQYLLPIFLHETRVLGVTSHSYPFFYSSLLEASLYLAITTYCLIYRTITTNRITFLFYYLILKKEFLPKSVIYKQMIPFLTLFIVFPYLNGVLLLIWEVGVLGLENFNAMSILEINNKFINVVIPYFGDILKTLKFEQVFAVTFSILSNMILTNVMSIIFILFGDHKIIKYILEKIYPKLAKWIQLRRRLQRYSLMMNIGWIILVTLMIKGTTITIFIMFS